MPRKRNKENSGLPAGWRKKNGAIYYQVPARQRHLWDNKQLFRLGKNEVEAYQEWIKRIQVKQDIRTIGQLLRKYEIEIVPGKSRQSQKKNIFELKQLRGVFGNMNIEDLEPQHVYKYMTNRSSKAAAQRERALLSHVFTMAVQWGYIRKHPFKGEIRVENAKPRTRYVEDWEVVECLALPAMRKKGSVTAIQSYIRLKLLTGLRKADLLRLRVSDFKEDGLHVSISKTGKTMVYKRSLELDRAIEDARTARPVDISPFIFCNKRGESYVSAEGEVSGWKSMWQRFFKRVLEETKVAESFTDHDLRAKVASDAESLERAKELLAHADSRITQKVYRRKAEIIKPVR